MSMGKYACALACTALVCACSFCFAQESKQKNDGALPIKMPGQDGSKKALDYEYFPSRLHAFVFRNWTCVRREKLAELVDTSVENIDSIAFQLGLPPQGKIEKDWKRKGYITVLRRNWHLLDYPQLLTLLEMSAEELEFKLIADDFLYIKLGSVKPQCGVLKYAPSNAQTLAKCEKFKKSIALGEPQKLFSGAERFRFAEEMATLRCGTFSGKNKGNVVMAHPYFAEFGDSLLDDELSSYPETLFEHYQKVGVNAIWTHVVLRTLVSNDGLYDDSPDAVRRIKNLNKLVEIAGKYSIKVYVYLNEPRSMPPAFFDSPERERLKGTPDGGMIALCTSQKRVVDWLENGTAKLFAAVPKLGGVFTITASECLTNCLSHRMAKNICPVCAKRGRPAVVSEVNNAILRGMRSKSEDAKMIVWDWGWRPEAVEGTVELLDKDCILMCVSEWDVPFERGGVKSAVNEYSISCSDSAPGPRAKNLWALAKKRGMRTMAKVQVNTTWEFSPVPYIPYLDIVANHAKNLADFGVENVLLNWSLGGYPSVNMEVFTSYDNTVSALENLRRAAVRRYGAEAAPVAMRAWTELSNAWREFPFDIVLAYFGPQHMGVSNPIYIRPSGYSATMVGIPYDTLASWRSKYPNDVLIGQLEKVSSGLKRGGAELEKVLDCDISKDAKDEISAQLRYIECAQISLKSFANQARFVVLRNRLGSEKTRELFDADKAEILKILGMEKTMAKRMYDLALKDEFLGFESSNHYFFIPADLLEKIASVGYAENYFSACEFSGLKK